VPGAGGQRHRPRRSAGAEALPQGRVQAGVPQAFGGGAAGGLRLLERETNRYLHMWNPKRMDEKCYDPAEGARLWERSLALCAELGAWR
jgi:hypothetical protein